MSHDYEPLRRAHREALDKQDAARQGEATQGSESGATKTGEPEPDREAARGRAQTRVNSPGISADAGDMVSQQRAANRYNEAAQEHQAQIHERSRPAANPAAQRSDGAAETPESGSPSPKAQEQETGSEKGNSERKIDPETSKAVEKLRASREAQENTTSRDADDSRAPASGRTTGRGY